MIPVPAVTVSGPDFATPTSAEVSTLLVTVLEVTLNGLVVLLAVALFKKTVPLGVDAFTVPLIITRNTSPTPMYPAEKIEGLVTFIIKGPLNPIHELQAPPFTL